MLAIKKLSDCKQIARQLSSKRHKAQLSPMNCDDLCPMKIEIFSTVHKVRQELIRRRDSERELLRSAPRKLPEFAEIAQNNCHYAVQGHSRSPILAPIESAYATSY